jgi:hypothetical protein
VEVHQCFGGVYCLHHQGDGLHRRDDGGGKYLWIVYVLLREYTSQYARRLSVFILAAVRTFNLTVADLGTNINDETVEVLLKELDYYSASQEIFWFLWSEEVRYSVDKIMQLNHNLS